MPYAKMTQRMTDTIKGPHVPFVVIKVLSIDGTMTNIPITGGSVKIDRTSQDARRTINFTTNDETLVPLHNADPLNIYANHIFAYRGVIWNRPEIDPKLWSANVPLSEEMLRPANLAYELVPVGVFRINSVTIDEKGDGTLELQVSGSDITSNIAKNHWTGTTTVWTTHYTPPIVMTQVSAILLNVQTLIASYFKEAIELLVRDRWPKKSHIGQPVFHFSAVADKKLLKPIVFGSTNPTSMSSTSPWTDISGIAASMGAEIFVDPEGAFTLLEIVDPNSVQPTWEFLDGEGGLLISATRKLDDSKAVNYVWATGESSMTQLPLRSIAINNDPSSPTYYGGDFGIVSAMEPGRKKLTTQAEVDLAAKTYLNWYTGGDEAVTIEGVVNPALDVGDVVRVRRQRLGIFNKRNSVASLGQDLFRQYDASPIGEIRVQPLAKPIGAGTTLQLINSFATQNVVVSANANKGDTVLHINPVTLLTNFRRYTDFIDPNTGGDGGTNYMVDSVTIPLDLDKPMEIVARERRVGTKQEAIRIGEYTLPDPWAVYN